MKDFLLGHTFFTISDQCLPPSDPRVLCVWPRIELLETLSLVRPRNSSADLRWQAMWMVQAVGMTNRYAFYSHLSDFYPSSLSVESRRVETEQRQCFLK